MPIAVNVIAAATLLFSFIPGDYGGHAAPHSSVADVDVMNKEMQTTAIDNQNVLEGIAVDLANDFMAPLYEDGLNLNTKEDYIHYYEKISNLGVADGFINSFFIEQNGKMEAIQTEPPMWLDPEQPYGFKVISDTEMEVSQFSSEEMYGPLTLIISYKKVNGKWIIDDVKYIEDDLKVNEV